MERSFDSHLLGRVAEKYKDIIGDFDATLWTSNALNHMYAHNESVGLATYEYPGVYSVHWFFEPSDRGSNAVVLAKRMLRSLFENSNAKTIRGLTPMEMRGVRILAKRVGMKSYGPININGKDYEILCMTKEDLK